MRLGPINQGVAADYRRRCGFDSPSSYHSLIAGFPIPWYYLFMGIPEFTNIFSKRVVPMDKEEARARLHAIWYQFKAKEITSERAKLDAIEIINASGMSAYEVAWIIAETKGYTPAVVAILSEN